MEFELESESRSRRVLHLESDGIFAVAHSELAPPQDRKFFFLPIDSGTMPLVRSRVEQTSILRKLVAFAHLHKDQTAALKG